MSLARWKNANHSGNCHRRQLTAAVAIADCGAVTTHHFATSSRHNMKLNITSQEISLRVANYEPKFNCSVSYQSIGSRLRAESHKELMMSKDSTTRLHALSKCHVRDGLDSVKKWADTWVTRYKVMTGSPKMLTACTQSSECSEDGRDAVMLRI